MTTLNLNWLQRQSLQHVVGTMPGLNVTVAPLGNTDRWQWRRDVRVTGGAHPIELALHHARIRVPTDASEPTSGAGLGRGINRGSDLEFWKALSRMGIVLLATAGPAYAADGSWSDVTNGAMDRMNATTQRGGPGSLRDGFEMGPGGWGSKTIYESGINEMRGRENPPSGMGSFVDNVYRGVQDFGDWLSSPGYTSYDSYPSPVYGVGVSDYGSQPGQGFRAEPGIGGGGGVAW